MTGSKFHQPNERWLKIDEVSRILGVTKKAIYNRSYRKSPNPLPRKLKPVRWGKRGLRWREVDVLEYIRNKKPE